MLISIVTLTNNSRGVIKRLVDRLLPELVEGRHELVFLDNNSTDGTPDYLRRIPFPTKKILTVPKGTFSHSKTRMWGAENCSGDIVVFFTDDIVPCSEGFLRSLTEPVESRSATAAYGVSLINPADSDPLRAHRYNDWYIDRPEIIAPLSPEEWQVLPPWEKRLRCNFDNCASCYDRKMLLQVKFPDLPYGEDMGIAKRFVTGGHAIALAKDARFYHWHNVSFEYFLKRMCVDQIVTKELFDLLFMESIHKLFMVITLQIGLYSLLAITVPGIPFRRRGWWMLYSTKHVIADNLGKYMGGLEREKVSKWNLAGRYLLRKKDSYMAEVIRNSIKRDK